MKDFPSVSETQIPSLIRQEKAQWSPIPLVGNSQILASVVNPFQACSDTSESSLYNSLPAKENVMIIRLIRELKEKIRVMRNTSTE